MGEFKEITYDETNKIKMSLKNAIGLISNIYTMDDCKKNGQQSVLTLLNCANAFISDYPEITNVKQDIYGILELLRRNLKDLDNDIFKTHYNEEMITYFYKIHKITSLEDYE